MGSTLELQNDFALWMKYAEFIQDKLKDASLMRAKFEQKLSNSKLLATKDKVEILLEHALFEEMQAGIPRARRILE